jgi:hypothetical protein
MTAPRPWTDDDDATLVDLYDRGLSLSAIANEMQRSKDTISKKAAKLDLSWDRTRTAAATQAKVADAKGRRADLQLALLGDAEKLRTQLWTESDYAQAVGGQDARVLRWSMTEPTPTDKLKLMQAAGAAIDRSLKLAEYDSDRAEGVRSLLGGIADAFGITPPGADA